MATHPDFSNESSFVEESNFIEVILADNVPSISSEDKEVQNIQYDLLKKFISSVYHDGVVTRPSFDVKSNQFSFDEDFYSIVKGHVVKVPKINLPITSGTNKTDIVFLEVFIKEVTVDSIIKKHGFENWSEQVDNKILSLFIGDVTSKRKQLCSRLRYVSGASSVAGSLAQGPNSSPKSGFAFSQIGDTGVYSCSGLDGVLGDIFAIPLANVIFTAGVISFNDLRISATATKDKMPYELIDNKNDKKYRYGYQVSDKGIPQIISEEVK